MDSVKLCHFSGVMTLKSPTRRLSCILFQFYMFFAWYAEGEATLFVFVCEAEISKSYIVFLCVNSHRYNANSLTNGLSAGLSPIRRSVWMKVVGSFIFDGRSRSAMSLKSLSLICIFIVNFVLFVLS